MIHHQGFCALCVTKRAIALIKDASDAYLDLEEVKLGGEGVHLPLAVSQLKEVVSEAVVEPYPLAQVLCQIRNVGTIEKSHHPYPLELAHEGGM